MSQLKWLPILALAGLAFRPALAEPNRPVYSHENSFPRWEQLEVGVIYNGQEYENGSFQSDVQLAGIYARYGVLDDLAVAVGVPFVEVDPAFGDSESGLGNVELEFQLRAYEDIFGYPYFIPYLNLSLPTGDEDKGLGTEDVVLTGGIAYGSKINDWIGWVLDVSYRVNQDVDNQIIVGHSYIWEVSEQFAILTELQYTQEFEDGEDAVVLGSGGFTYNWTPDLQMGVSVAGGITGPVDVETNVRLSYSF